MANEQRRAAAGGEFGANGEWYAGGEFIATQEDTVKGAGAERVQTPAQAAAAADRQAQADRINEWLAGRQAAVAGIVAALTANPGDVDAAVWAQRVVDHAAGFLPSLGRTLHVGGTLTERQAVAALKGLHGRRVKANAAEWDRTLALLTEEFPG